VDSNNRLYTRRCRRKTTGVYTSVDQIAHFGSTGIVVVAIDLLVRASGIGIAVVDGADIVVAVDNLLGATGFSVATVGIVLVCVDTPFDVVTSIDRTGIAIVITVYVLVLISFRIASIDGKIVVVSWSHPSVVQASESSQLTVLGSNRIQDCNSP